MQETNCFLKFPSICHVCLVLKALMVKKSRNVYLLLIKALENSFFCFFYLTCRNYPPTKADLGKDSAEFTQL
jgi:hypothetical protein